MGRSKIYVNKYVTWYFGLVVYMPCLVLGDDPEYLACAVNKYTKRFYSIRKEKYQKNSVFGLFFTHWTVLWLNFRRVTRNFLGQGSFLRIRALFSNFRKRAGYTPPPPPLSSYAPEFMINFTKNYDSGFPSSYL